MRCHFVLNEVYVLIWYNMHIHEHLCEWGVPFRYSFSDTTLGWYEAVGQYSNADEKGETNG